MSLVGQQPASLSPTGTGRSTLGTDRLTNRPWPSEDVPPRPTVATPVSFRRSGPVPAVPLNTIIVAQAATRSILGPRAFLGIRLRAAYPAMTVVE